MYLNLDPAFQIKLLVQVKIKVAVFTRFDSDFFKRKSMPFCLFDSVGTLLIIDYVFVNFGLLLRLQKIQNFMSINIMSLIETNCYNVK